MRPYNQLVRLFSRDLKLWLTINAQNRFLEVSWQNAPTQINDQIVVTKHEPLNFEFVDCELVAAINTFSSENQHIDNFNKENKALLKLNQESHQLLVCNDIITVIKPNNDNDWHSTCVPYNWDLTPEIARNTISHDYWASYIDACGTIVAKNCLRSYPRWMHDLYDFIGNLRLRDLFIPGTHDSGCYQPGFNPKTMDTHITKYTITQDDDIYSQLIHGARYLDIRVGYYWFLSDKFFTVHGFIRQRPLREIIEQIRKFVLETNEIVILGLKQFPIGFGNNLDVHRHLVAYLVEQLGNLSVNPLLSWNATVRQFWDSNQYIILAYDEPNVVKEFPHVLFDGVEQRWGNVQNLINLESYLKEINVLDIATTSRPVADMAELTPNAWGVLFDQFGGLRRMADYVNPRISRLYRDELGKRANIVAVDFIRGTTLVESAIEWNMQKLTEKCKK